MQQEAIIGLEIHAQLSTSTKMFCYCANQYKEEPNVNVCPVCLGLPGALPTINKRAVEHAVKLGLITGCNVNLASTFARKHYFYPDLPKGYQISQFENPICENGFVDIKTKTGTKRIGITRIHIEEDAGKLVHEGADPMASYVDLNRAGVPLLEIVSEPDLRTAEEARLYMEKIYALVTYAGICQGDMEKGNLRCDANISIRNLGDTHFNIRTETKNLNSFKFVQQAIEYEIFRQIDAVADGYKIVQETRLFNSSTKQTFSMRKKEDSQDYRYFPCPDLPNLQLTDDFIKKIKQAIPEMPSAKVPRFMEFYGLSEYDAELLVANKEMASYFETVTKLGAKAKSVANWLLGDFSKLLNETNSMFDADKIKAQYLVDLIKLVEDEVISSKIAKKVFRILFETGKAPKQVVQEEGLTQISDKEQIKKMVVDVITNNPNEVSQYKAGKDRVLGFFVGQIMAKTKGKGNPQLINQFLLELLKK